MRSRDKYFLLILLIPFVTNCGLRLAITTNYVNDRTMLEAQAVGNYKLIEDELWRYASVRTDNTIPVGEKQGAVDYTTERTKINFRLLRAVQTREMLKNEIDEYKKKGLLVEQNTGYVEISPDKLELLAKSEDIKKRLDVLKEEENSARKNLFLSIIESNKDLDKSKLKDIETAFSHLIKSDKF